MLRSTGLLIRPLSASIRSVSFIHEPIIKETMPAKLLPFPEPRKKPEPVGEPIRIAGNPLVVGDGVGGTEARDRFRRRKPLGRRFPRVPGECPFMFLPEAAWIHRAHGALRKITGPYPV
jgi:hypothetical protein